jgi:hypothetical protein
MTEGAGYRQIEGSAALGRGRSMVAARRAHHQTGSRGRGVSGIVLIDGVGIEVPGHPVADFFSMTMDEVFIRAFITPEPFRVDPASLPPAAKAVAAGEQCLCRRLRGHGPVDERSGPGQLPAARRHRSPASDGDP